MTRLIVTVVACATLLWAGIASAADCEQQRYNAAAKYSACQLKALGKYLKSAGDAEAFVKLDLASKKCTVKYAATWPKLQAIGAAPCSGGRFVDNLDGTVTDNLTGLQWEKKTNLDGTANPADPHDADNNYQWSSTGIAADGAAFTNFLSTLNGGCFAGQCDWRLPSLAELQAIRALSPSKPYGCSGSPCIDPAFGPEFGTSFGYLYWSSTTAQDNAIFAWCVLFGDGETGESGKTGLQFQYVRAVRGGV